MKKTKLKYQSPNKCYVCGKYKVRYIEGNVVDKKSRDIKEVYVCRDCREKANGFIVKSNYNNDKNNEYDRLSILVEILSSFIH